MTRNITVIIPSLNEERHIGQLLTSLLPMRDENEILVIDGGSNDRTTELVQHIIASAGKKSPQFKLLHNPAKLQAQALNLGLEAATATTCLRLDAHLQIPKNCTFQNEIDILLQAIDESPQCCAAGFKQRFMGHGIIDSAIALLSVTPFLSGFSLYRYALKPCTTHNTAWLICVDKRLAINAGGFDPLTTPNEDQNFNQRLVKYTGKPILIYPDLPLYYQPRSTLQGLLRQYFKYGFVRARSTGVAKSKYRNLLSLASPLALFSISIFYAGALIATPITYLASLIFILICNIIAFATDKLHALRNRGISRPRLYVLITALLLSPLIAAVPSLARSCGSLWYLARSNRAANTTLLL